MHIIDFVLRRASSLKIDNLKVKYASKIVSLSTVHNFLYEIETPPSKNVTKISFLTSNFVENFGTLYILRPIRDQYYFSTFSFWLVKALDNYDPRFSR